MEEKQGLWSSRSFQDYLKINYIWENLEELISQFGQILYSFHICDIIFDLFNF